MLAIEKKLHLHMYLRCNTWHLPFPRWNTGFIILIAGTLKPNLGPSFCRSFAKLSIVIPVPNIKSEQEFWSIWTQAAWRQDARQEPHWGGCLLGPHPGINIYSFGQRFTLFSLRTSWTLWLAARTGRRPPRTPTLTRCTPTSPRSSPSSRFHEYLRCDLCVKMIPI